MNFRGAIAALFGGVKQRQKTSLWWDVNGFNAVFSPFNTDLYANDVARASIHTLAEHTSKANAIIRSDPKLERMIRLRPNLYMNGKDFLYKCRTLLEVNNTCFVFINRDDAGKCIGLYPIPACQSEAVESGGELYIKFWLKEQMVIPWADLAVLRKHYNTSDIMGDTNAAVTTSIDLLKTTSEGMGNAIKSTANLRGILKSTKAMLSDDDVKKQKDRFVADYLSLENSSGIAMLDSTVDFKAVDVKPEIATYEHIGQLRDNIYRYFGVSEDAIQGKLFGDAWEAFYDSAIEPFLISLGQELTYKIFTDRQRGFGNEVLFESSRMQYMSMKDKLQLIQLVDRKTMVPNEVRAILNLPPVPWGDEPLFWQDPKGEAEALKNEPKQEDDADASETE